MSEKSIETEDLLKLIGLKSEGCGSWDFAHQPETDLFGLNIPLLSSTMTAVFSREQFQRFLADGLALLIKTVHQPNEPSLQ